MFNVIAVQYQFYLTKRPQSQSLSLITRDQHPHPFLSQNMWLET
jgi:hypothetical protein